MADSHAKPNHDYHLVNPSPWPLVGASFTFLTAVGTNRVTECVDSGQGGRAAPSAAPIRFYRVVLTRD